MFCKDHSSGRSFFVLFVRGENWRAVWRTNWGRENSCVFVPAFPPKCGSASSVGWHRPRSAACVQELPIAVSYRVQKLVATGCWMAGQGVAQQPLECGHPMHLFWRGTSQLLV